MKNNKWIMVLLSICLWSAVGESRSDFVGNGGDLVVCKDVAGATISTELLDFYEARVLDGHEIKIDATATYDEALEVLIERLGLYDGYGQEVLRGLASTFMAEARFPEGVELVDVPDSQHIALKKGCELQQVAIQIEPQFPGEKRYTVSKDLWDQMSAIDQAGLVMHEVIFNRVIKSKFRRTDVINSRSTRFFNALLATDRLNVYDFREYLDFLKKEFGIECAYIEGYRACEIGYHGGSDKVASFETKFGVQTTIQVGSELSIDVKPDWHVTFEKRKNNSLSGVKIENVVPTVVLLSGRRFELSGAANFLLDEEGLVTSMGSSSSTIKIYHPVKRMEEDMHCGRFNFDPDTPSEVVCINEPISVYGVNGSSVLSNPLKFSGFKRH